jgi:transposase
MEDKQEKDRLAAYIGIDWGKKQHAICHRDAVSGQLENSLLEHKPESLSSWVRELRARYGGRRIGIALEQSKGPLIYALMSHDFIELYPVNPKQLARYREAFRVGNPKGDPSDAALLQEMLELHRSRLRVWKVDDEQTRLLRILVHERRDVIDEGTRLINRLDSLLCDYFPQAIDLIGNLRTKKACDFLEKWPTLESLQNEDQQEVTSFFRTRRSNKNAIQAKLDKIRTAAPLTSDSVIIASSVIKVKGTIKLLRVIIEQTEDLEQQIEQLYDQHKDKEIFDSLPGAGKALGPRLLVAMGSDRDRYNSALEIQEYSGIAPVTRQSGNTRTVQRRYGCPVFLKQTFHEHAHWSIRKCEWAKAYYSKLRKAGKGHNAAIRSLAYKWIRIIFKCWKDGKPYDESVYLKALQSKGSDLLELVA